MRNFAKHRDLLLRDKIISSLHRERDLKKSSAVFSACSFVLLFPVISRQKQGSLSN